MRWVADLQREGVIAWALDLQTLVGGNGGFLANPWLWSFTRVGFVENWARCILARDADLHVAACRRACSSARHGSVEGLRRN